MLICIYFAIYMLICIYFALYMCIYINTHTEEGHSQVKNIIDQVTVKVNVAQSCLTLCNPTDCSPRNSPGQNTGVGSLALLQGIFSNQGLNLGFQHCRPILYQLNHQGSSRIMEWVA